MHGILLVFCQLNTNIDISGKRESQLRKCSHSTGLSASLWCIFLIDVDVDWAHPTGGWGNPG